LPSPPFKDFLKPDYLGVFGLLEEPQGILLVANRRVIGGRPEVVWDLPGGGVEPKETLAEALRREMREETALDVSVGEFLLVTEGERIRQGHRVGVWRSFFFRIARTGGEIDISKEPDLVDFRFVPRADLVPLLTAPYHRGFALWLASGVRHAFDRWID
jgi:8-oxo-dGTP pyrophosphatase MutT (NUDIX family)